MLMMIYNPGSREKLVVEVLYYFAFCFFISLEFSFRNYIAIYIVVAILSTILDRQKKRIQKVFTAKALCQRCLRLFPV